ncbi:hypothetical protein PAF17_18900 [Paracoccus sp. Z330]|uniref:Uncharacterized protein n=1 Tax=Paracoccus onchidii TaxID=3017813 RepID=A0ABT4ZKL8_9RHOB|nr:hypothetical protein [Paracoccus onchidii]MDB6179543.1 hypothetical protein [Paracoccus onchidii]
MNDTTKPITVDSLITAMSLLNSTRCLMTVTDWQNPAHVAAAQEGVDGTIELVMLMLEQVADDLGCRVEANARIKAGTDRTWSIIADHQKGGRA